MDSNPQSSLHDLSAVLPSQSDVVERAAAPIRLRPPSSFSGAERPRADPRDHVFSLNLWLDAVPDQHKLAYAASTLTGVARKEWRLLSVNSLQSYTSFCTWLLQRFEIIDAAEVARQTNS